jgi:hypothetical protein
VPFNTAVANVNVEGSTPFARFINAVNRKVYGVLVCISTITSRYIPFRIPQSPRRGTYFSLPSIIDAIGAS